MWKDTERVKLWCAYVEKQREDAATLIAELEAALAERDRMLRLARSAARVGFDLGFDAWLAALRSIVER
jgi:hypothetical protein